MKEVFIHLVEHDGIDDVVVCNLATRWHAVHRQPCDWVEGVQQADTSYLDDRKYTVQMYVYLTALKAFVK